MPIKVTVLVKRKEGMSLEEFHNYWYGFFKFSCSTRRLTVINHWPDKTGATRTESYSLSWRVRRSGSYGTIKYVPQLPHHFAVQTSNTNFFLFVL